MKTIQIVLIANMVMSSLGFAFYTLSMKNANATILTTTSCVAAPVLSQITYEFNTTQVIALGLDPQKISGTYSVGFYSADFISTGFAWPVCNRFDFGAYTYPTYGSVTWILPDADYSTIMSFYFTNPQIAFNSGKFVLYPYLRNSSYQFRLAGYYIKVDPAAPVSSSYVYQNQALLSPTDLILKFKLPCLYIPKSTIIVITFPTPVSKVDPSYSQNPLDYFDTFFCGAMIDGVTPSGMACNVYGGSLYLENFMSADRTNMDFEIQLSNIITLPSFLGKPTIQFYSGANYTQNLYFQDNISATVAPITAGFKNAVFAPLKINQPGFTFTVDFAGNLKVPILAGSYVRYQFVQNFASTQSANIKIINPFNSAFEVGVPNFDGTGYTYTFTKDYLFDVGFKMIISNLNTPPLAKTYYTTLVFYSPEGMQIGSNIIVPMRFVA